MTTKGQKGPQKGREKLTLMQSLQRNQEEFQFTICIFISILILMIQSLNLNSLW